MPNEREIPILTNRTSNDTPVSITSMQMAEIASVVITTGVLVVGWFVFWINTLHS